MGYEKPSTKLTFYKAFFSTQWKFFIHTILHSLSAKRTSWNEFSSAMASALICLSSGQRFNFSKYIFESLVRNVDSTSKFYMYPRVGKGFSGVKTALFENILAIRAVDAEEEVQVPAQDDVVQKHVIEEIATEVVQPTPTSPSPSSPVIPSSPPHQSPSPPQPQAAKGSSHLVQQGEELESLNKVKSSKLRCLRKVGTSQRVESSEDEKNMFNQGRISVDMDQDEGVELVVDQEKDAEVEGRQADTQVEIYNIDLDHSSKVAAASAPIPATKPAAKPKVLKIAAAPAVSTRKRMGVVIRDPEEELHDDTLAETPSVKDKGKGILIEDPKPVKKKDQIEMDAEYAKKLHEELEKEHEEAYKQIDWNATFDHNTEGFKMEFFKGKTYDQILLIFQARFDANIKFLFKSREEMEKEDEQIIKSINETPAQKAAKKRKLSEEAQEADNLRGCLEIVPEEYDDVFVEAIPLTQKAPVVDYQLFLLVERRYPLSRFTLEQLVNVARLQVEEESKMSLELLRFTRQ
nr:glutamic acid-rich protein-like [Tanacetum cinerariifolium]